MYAVVRHGGHQYRVSPGDRLVVDRLDSEVGAVVALAPVLLLSDSEGVEVSAAGLEGIRVAATVTGHRRGPKIRVFTFKPKKRHRRTLGFRAELTELVVDRFVPNGEALPEAVEVVEPLVATAPAASEPAPKAGEQPEPGAPPTRRRRRAPGAGAAEGEDGGAAAMVEPAAPSAAAAPPTPEVSPAKPARRARKPATDAALPEAEPEQAAPPAAAPGTRKRRVGRASAEPEAGE